MTKTKTGPRYATDIPKSITTPDTHETSIGTLSLVAGFPNDATVEAVCDNLDLQRATQAFLRGLPFASLRPELDAAGRRAGALSRRPGAGPRAAEAA